MVWFGKYVKLIVDIRLTATDTHNAHNCLKKNRCILKVSVSWDTVACLLLVTICCFIMLWLQPELCFLLVIFWKCYHSLCIPTIVLLLNSCTWHSCLVDQLTSHLTSQMCLHYRLGNKTGGYGFWTRIFFFWKTIIKCSRPYSLTLF